MSAKQQTSARRGGAATRSDCARKNELLACLSPYRQRAFAGGECSIDLPEIERERERRRRSVLEDDVDASAGLKGGLNGCVRAGAHLRQEVLCGCGDE